jgi:hypothetical protein
MKKLVCLIILSACFTASALPYKRGFRDMKLPTQKMIEYQAFTDLAAAAADNALDGVDGPSSAAAVQITSFDAQPDAPRNVYITPGGTTAHVAACTVTVTGTNINDEVITEDLAFAENASTATTGSKAFKSITSVDFPADCEDTSFAATWDMGYGEKIGLKRCMDQAGHLVFTTVAGAYEATRATVAADASNVEGNTLDFNGTMNGSNDFEAFFIQNFAQSCYP